MLDFFKAAMRLLDTFNSSAPAENSERAAERQRAAAERQKAFLEVMSRPGTFSLHYTMPRREAWRYQKPKAD